jgi:glyoxylase-like metal-dependent hydrolase (beta-lactamase superfamily II)
MEVMPITENVFQLTLPIVNVFLVIHSAGLILIDCGPKGSSDLIFQGIEKIGKKPEDLRFIILTHAHHDHAGGLAAILKVVNVPVYTSALCAEMIKKGIAFRPTSNVLAFLLKLFTLNSKLNLQFLYIQPVKSTVKIVNEGDCVPDEKGLQVINAPGHCAEQIALFYPIKEALLFAADTAGNEKQLKPAFAYQSKKINQHTLRKLTTFSFEIAVFGHGKPIIKSGFVKMADFKL